ncbi:MAG: hypothetical protein EBS19_09975 [Spirochaetia bacterium]|nr:hypothetical protein [Spirochaetia bacterium]
MKMLLTSFIFSLFLATGLVADILTLKTGEEIDGIYLGGDNKTIQFETLLGINTIPRIKITKLEIGYSGSSFCYTLKNKVQKCEGILHSVNEKNIILGTGRGSLKKEIIPLSLIIQIQVSKSNKNQNLLGIFEKGMEVEIYREGIKEKGRIIDYNLLDKKVFFERDGEKLEIQESEILSIVWKKKPGILQYSKLALDYLIPGTHQIESNRALGITMTGLFTVLALAIPYEYQSAQVAAAKNVDIIPLGNSYIIVSGIDSDPSFNQHKRNYYSAIGGLGALYLVHTYQIFKDYRTGKIPGFNTLEVSVFKNQTELKSIIPTYNNGIGTNIELKFSYSF